MYPFINLANLAIPTRPFLLIIGVWLALSTAEQAAKRTDTTLGQKIYSIGLLCLLAAVLGARLTFAFFNLGTFSRTPLALIWPLTSGYSFWGGLAFGLAALFLAVRRQRLAWGTAADALAPAVLVGLAALSMADWLGGPGYGVYSAALGGRHPVQIYELGVVGLAVLAWWRALHQQPYAGYATLVGAAVCAAGFVVTLPFRAEGWSTMGFNLGQVGAAGVMLAMFMLLAYLAPGASGPPKVY